MESTQPNPTKEFLKKNWLAVTAGSLLVGAGIYWHTKKSSETDEVFEKTMSGLDQAKKYTETAKFFKKQHA